MIIDKNLYERIVEKKKRLDKQRPLSPILVARLREQIISEWTYNSNAIEGTKLTLQETELVLKHGLTINGIPLKDHLETINHKEAILFLEGLIKQKNKRFTILSIRQFHQLILNKIDPNNAGKYREVMVKITGSNFGVSLPINIPTEMRSFEKWLNSKSNRINIVDFGALAHFKLVKIHPFIDGNGRTARLLMNLIYMTYGFPPVVILKSERKKYYSALQSADKGILSSFVNFVGQSLERSLSLYLDAVTPEKEKDSKDKWILLSRISQKVGVSQEYLSLLARRGVIEAIKKGRNWHSTENAVSKYFSRDV